MIDCTHARLLWVLQRREAHDLDAAETAALERHVDQCPLCLAWTHQERRADEAVQAAVRAVPVPAPLSDKIQARLRHERRPRRAPWAVAAAAAVLFALSLGGYFWYAAPPALDVTDFTGSDLGYVSIDDPSAIEKSAESVEAWFAERGAAITAPRALRYELFDFCDFKTIKNRQIPWLQFVYPGDAESRGAKADVYVIPADQFNVDKLLEHVNSPWSGWRHTAMTVEVIDEGQGRLYVVVHTAGSLAPFKAHQRFQ